MKRCISCILPDCTPGITFDQMGVCGHCHTYAPFERAGETQLLSLLERHRRTDGGYDCMVPLSGGRDSTFTLYKLVRDYGMKVLAVNYENPFTHPQARANIENATAALGVELVRFELGERIHERSFKHYLTTWLRAPSPALIPMVCLACKTMWWRFLSIARKHGIHCIVSGGNPFEYTSFKKELLQVGRDVGHEEMLTRAAGGLLKQLLHNPAYLSPSYLPTMATAYLFGDPYTIGTRLLGRGILREDLFHYLEWNEQTVLSTIQTQLGWDYPRQQGSTWRFDCRIGHLKDVMYMSTIGMTEKDDFYSKMIREGSMTRQQALARIETENKLAVNDVRALLDEYGIPQGGLLRHAMDEISAHQAAR